MSTRLTRLRAMLARLHKSMTIWFNAAAGTLLIYWADIQASMPDLERLMTPDAYAMAVKAMLVGNILLRFKTTTALDQK